MRSGLSLEEFARLTHIDVADVERYRSAGLLDPDGDGEFDEYDIIRLRFMQLAGPDLIATDEPEELAKVIEDLARLNPWGDVLYGAQGSRLPLEEAASRIGLSREQARSLQVATGVSDAFINEDALTTMKDLLDAGIPWEAIIEGSRVLGDSIRRVADTEVRLFHTHVHERLLKEGVPNDEVVRTIRATSEAVLPVLDRVLQILHRAHILRASVEDALVHLEGDEPAAVPGAMDTSILFVDIALFTTLAQTHGDSVAIEVVERFDDLVRGIALDHHGNIVKQIGDEFMLAFNNPEDAVRFAVALDEVAAREENFPALRMAINHGPVVFRLGDYFGNTVNIASRIASMAASGEILITEAVARAAERAGVPVESAGVRIARGVAEPLTLWRVVHHGVKGKRDPVCGMMVGDGAAGRFTYEGQEYGFCSAECLSKFLQEPRRYVEEAERS
jgi:adenylate cyclase